MCNSETDIQVYFFKHFMKDSQAVCVQVVISELCSIYYLNKQWKM